MAVDDAAAAVERLETELQALQARLAASEAEAVALRDANDIEDAE